MRLIAIPLIVVLAGCGAIISGTQHVLGLGREVLKRLLLLVFIFALAGCCSGTFLGNPVEPAWWCPNASHWHKQKVGDQLPPVVEPEVYAPRVQKPED
ncbi:MAG: hypothetical protein ACLQVJ_17075 [Syntrophobacteraceae bacterium]